MPEIEHHIRTIKERVRAVYNVLPFNTLPNRMIAELIYSCNFWLNFSPADDGVSDILSSRAIIVGTTIDFNTHCRLEYGTYFHTHEPHDNSLATRTTGAIALRPTGNEQGGHYFYSLTTGRILRRNNWTVLPMPDDIIEQIHMIARRDKGHVNGINITDRQGNPIIFEPENNEDNDIDNIDNDINDFNDEDPYTNDVYEPIYNVNHDDIDI